jgi:hypothetical protein
LLSEKGAAPGSVSYNASTALWLDGADLIRRDPAAVSPTEIELWRRIGGRLDFDAGSIVEYLGPVPSEGTPVLDPLKSLSAQRIAIVTLQERAAEVARELLRKRSEAEFVLVCEHVPGPATAAARSADVILFAWAANKHAVYNAFQDARDRLVYVPGKGASSIIRTLEQWVRKRSEPASTVQ